MGYDEFERKLRSAFADAIKEADKTQYQIMIRPDCLQWEIFCVTSKNKYMLRRSIPLEDIRSYRFPDRLIDDAVQSALQTMITWDRWKEWFKMGFLKGGMGNTCKAKFDDDGNAIAASRTVALENPCKDCGASGRANRRVDTQSNAQGVTYQSVTCTHCHGLLWAWRCTERLWMSPHCIGDGSRKKNMELFE